MNYDRFWARSASGVLGEIRQALANPIATLAGQESILQFQREFHQKTEKTLEEILQHIKNVAIIQRQAIPLSIIGPNDQILAYMALYDLEGYVLLCNPIYVREISVGRGPDNTVTRQCLRCSG